MRIIGPVLAVGPVLCFFLVGERWLRLFVASLVILPFLLLFALLVSLMDTFSFDDANRQITRRSKRPVPYNEVQSVELVAAGGLIQAKVRTGRRRKEVLAVGLSAADEPGLRREFAKRFRPESIHATKSSIFKEAAVVLLLVGAVYAAGQAYLQRKYPAISVDCTQVDWKIGSETMNESSYTLSGMSLRVPPPFHLVRQSKSELLFQDTILERVLIARPTLYEKRDDQTKAISAYLLGIRSDYSLLRFGYCARFGIIPLMLKGVVLSNVINPRIYEVRSGAYRALVVSALRGARTVATMVVVDEQTGSEVSVSLSSRRPIEESPLKEVLAGISRAAAD
jgi:hypothetical protein